MLPKLAYGILSVFLLLSAAQGFSQAADSVAVADTLITDTVKKHSPNKAALLSAVIPGAGQIYNRKYWKVPVIYTGLGAVAYLIGFNNKYYKDYRNAYRTRMDDDPNTTDAFVNRSDNDIKLLRDYYRRNLEFTYVAGVAIYVINILDAAVDAYLFRFDIDEDLTVQLSPALSGSPVFSPMQPSAGFSLVLKWK